MNDFLPAVPRARAIEIARVVRHTIRDVFLYASHSTQVFHRTKGGIFFSRRSVSLCVTFLKGDIARRLFPLRPKTALHEKKNAKVTMPAERETRRRL